MLSIDLLCRQMHTHTHRHTNPRTQSGPCRLEGLYCLPRIIVCVYVYKMPCPKRSWTMKSVTRGMWISVSLSLPLPYPVQVPLHIWISPPADKEQGSGWREERNGGGEEERGIEIGGRGVCSGARVPTS